MSETIPQELRDLPRWILQLNKKPYDAKNPKCSASSTDSATWSNYTTAVEAQVNGYGLGFVFSATDDIMGIDLDHCRDPKTGEVRDWAQDIVDRMCSYTEISPSGTGLHIYIHADIALPRNRKSMPDGGGFEIYQSARYFTVTGNHIPETPYIIESRDQEVDDLISDIFTPEERGYLRSELPNPTGLGKEEVLNRLHLAKNSDKFRTLYYRGFMPNGDYQSKSEADAALASLVAFWAGGDAELIRDIMWDSELRKQDDAGKKKWYEDSYLFRTIDFVLKSCSDFYSPPRQYKLTDLGNAERLADQHRDKVRYCEDSKTWIAWNGKRWHTGFDTRVTQLATETVRSILSEACECEDSAQRNQLTEWALRCEDNRRIEALIKLARAQPQLTVTVDQLDADPWLLNCQNGTLDLRTGELREHSPDDLITQIAAAAYRPDANYERFDAYLMKVLPNAEIRTHVQKYFGYCLTGCTGEDAFLIAHGPTRTGKSTLAEAMKATLGDYGQAVELTNLLGEMSNAGSASPDLRGLMGTRLAIAGELPKQFRASIPKLKKLTGGDTVTARKLHENPVEFKPQVKLWIHSNFLPDLPADDQAVWERVQRIPFEVQILEKDQDKTLRRDLETLIEAREAILAWAVEGCRLWQEQGLNMPKGVVDATDEYKHAQDELWQFIQDCCELDKSSRVPLQDLKSVYRSWSYLESLEQPIKEQKLAKELERFGVSKVRQRGESRSPEYFLLGIKLKETDHEADEEAGEVTMEDIMAA